MDVESIRSRIREVADFPALGVGFKDITPLLGDAAAFRAAIEHLVAPIEDVGVDVVVGIEARGFVVAAPVALGLGVGFIPVRKPHKLPAAVHSVRYQLEYGEGVLEMHADALSPGARCLVVDDVLATGGTAAATAELIENQGGRVVAFSFIVELAALGGRGRIDGRAPVFSTVRYEA